MSDATDRDEDLMTVVEVADHLRVSERFVRKLIADRHLPAVKVGSRVVRVRRSAVASLLRPVATPGPDPAGAPPTHR